MNLIESFLLEESGTIICTLSFFDMAVCIDLVDLQLYMPAINTIITLNPIRFFICLYFTGVPEAALASFCVRYFFYFLPLYLFNLMHNHLRYAVAVHSIMIFV